MVKGELKLDLPIEADTPLISSALVDSLQVTRLLVALEARYRVRIDPQDIGVDNFDTARQMREFIASIA